MTVNIQCTRRCNFACTYCYEKEHHRSLDLEGESLEDTKKLLSGLFKNHSKLDLIFIGGEPTLNQKNSTDLINWGLENNLINTVCIITNGSNSELIKQFKGNLPKEKYSIQISYDGKKINDQFRRTKSNKKTTDLVLSNIQKLIDDNWNVVLKSTIPITGLHLVPDIMREFQKSGTQYNVSEDFTTIIKRHKLNPDLNSWKDTKDYINKTFTEILMLEIEYLKKNPNAPACTKWFRDYDTNLKKSCNAGINFININEKAQIQYCHHLDSSNQEIKDKLKITDSSIPEQQLKDLTEFSTRTKKELTEADITDCSSCSALYCNKCTVLNTGDLYGKHSDEFMCLYFKEISKYIKIYDTFKRKL